MKVFDPDDYVVDTATRRDAHAFIKGGALLYRVTSRTFSDPQSILNGEGALLGEGRYHQHDPRNPQPTSYCSNNVLLCLSEALFRVHRAVFDSIQDGIIAPHLNKYARRERCLVVFAVDQIDDLVYVDSDGAKSLYYKKLNGPTVISPDLVYTPLQDFSLVVRGKGKNGVAYPSARHSQDLAFALFNDHTPRVLTSEYYVLKLQLQLVPEDFSRKPPAPIRFQSQKPHHTIGYYEFADPDAFESLQRRGLINPSDPALLPPQGYIDFVRRRYDDLDLHSSYSDKKVIHCL